MRRPCAISFSDFFVFRGSWGGGAGFCFFLGVWGGGFFFFLGGLLHALV